MKGTTFEIGLVGAGAISAGAYTGGVVDFMVQALDCWYAAKGTDPLAPPHDVRLSVFSGASAGGMTAALAAAYLGSDQPPIADEDAAARHQGRNKLFDSWVERIDISRLLESRDLENPQNKVVSLLDSSVLPEIADSGVQVTPRPTRRPYLADNFELILTVTNLRGVPYAFGIQSNKPELYEMSLHADYVRFRINDTGGGGLPDRYTMSWADFGKPASPEKKILSRAALASGAFPVGLAPRELEHVIPGGGIPGWYSSREWPLPTPESANPHQCVSYSPIPVKWGKLEPEFRYAFQCVDGGVMNNEPLELARRVLAGPQHRNARLGELANKAVLLIDPFPNNAPFEREYAPAPDLLQTALQLFGALKEQARFKPDELMLAAKDDVYSRFMIAPSRADATYPIASGSLGGFGGFLKRSFRAHDYFLGRRNAQKFFRDHFALPENNELFKDWSAQAREQYCVRDGHRQPVVKDGQRLLPIIPLVGAAEKECPSPPWPSYSREDLAQLLRQVEDRVDVVVDRLVSQYFKQHNCITRFVAKLVIGRKKRDIVAGAGKQVTSDLEKMGLMR